MKVTENFDASEFDQKHPFELYPEKWYEKRLKPLCRELEVIRAYLGGVRITITSGYRTPEYNASIPGAAKSSQHMYGRAADFVAEGKTAAEVHAACVELYHAGKLKIGGLGEYPNWTHIDIREGNRLARWKGSRK